jgi:HK97 family phage major capsid protein
VLTKIAISLKELNASPEITQELADFNSFNIESFLIDSLSAQFAEQEAQLFWNGTGADGEPTGLEVDSSITSTTTASSGEVDYQDVVNLYYSLGAKYRKNATFVMNSDSQKKLVGLVDADGNPIFATATGGASATLMGRPVVIDDHAADGYWFMDAKRSIVGLGHTSGLRILRNPYRKQGYISFDSGHYFGFGVVDYAGIVNMTIAA